MNKVLGFLLRIYWAHFLFFLFLLFWSFFDLFYFFLSFVLHFYRLQLRERDLDRYLFFFLDFSFLTLLLRLLDDSESLLDEDSYELDELDEDEEDDEDDEDEEASRFLIISFTYFSYYQFVLLF